MPMAKTNPAIASGTRRTYTVQELTKYGFRANDTYVNYSKNISEADKGRIIPGLTFDAEVYVAASGKEYIEKIVSTVDVVGNLAVSPSGNKTENPRAATKPVPAKSDTMSKEEWSEKDKRIGRAGAIQVAVQVIADFDGAVALADKMLKYIWTTNVNQNA